MGENNGTEPAQTSDPDGRISNSGAVMVLNHFCEQHGPRIVFCTLFDPNSSGECLFELAGEAEKEFSSVSPACCASLKGSIYSSDSWGGFCSSHDPPPCFFASAMNACVKSLSCEDVGRAERPALFADDYGVVLFHKFRLRDPDARGALRYFSVVLLARSGGALAQAICGFNVLCCGLLSFSTGLQHLADVAFQSLHPLYALAEPARVFSQFADARHMFMFRSPLRTPDASVSGPVTPSFTPPGSTPGSPTQTPPDSPRGSPPHSPRLRPSSEFSTGRTLLGSWEIPSPAISTSALPRTPNAGTASPVGAQTPGTPGSSACAAVAVAARSRRASTPSNRGDVVRARGRRVPLMSLEDLVQVPDLWERVHVAFCMLLRDFCAHSLGKRVEEAASYPSPFVPGNRLLRDYEPEDASAVVPVGRAQWFGKSRPSEVPRMPFRQGEHADSLGGAAALLWCAAENKTPFLECLLWNLVIGNQIVFVCDSGNLTRALVETCENFVPSRCVTSLSFSSSWPRSWEANVVGIAASIVDESLELAGDTSVWDSTVTVVRADPNPSYDRIGRGVDAPPPSVDGTTASAAAAVALAKWKWSCRPGSPMPRGGCSVVEAYVHIVKTRSSESSKRQLVATVRTRWDSLARAFFSRMREVQSSAVSAKSSPPGSTLQGNEFVRAFALRSADLQVLRFWTTGLRKVESRE